MLVLQASTKHRSRGALKRGVWNLGTKLEIGSKDYLN